jgi:hypothetical protein
MKFPLVFVDKTGSTGTEAQRTRWFKNPRFPRQIYAVHTAAANFPIAISLTHELQ